MKTIMSYILYPLAIASSIAAFQFLKEYLDYILLLSVIVTFWFVVIRIFEFIIPREKSWNEIIKSDVTDVYHAIFTKFGTKLVAKIAFYSLLVALSSDIGGLMGMSLFPENAPLLLQLVLCLLIVELPSYWIHRISHKKSFLWRLHEIHHSSEKMWILNVTRAHPLDLLTRHIIPFSILILLSVPTETVAVYLIVVSLVSFLQHSNLKLNTGVINYFLVTPEVHHQHHDKDIHRGDCNFGHVLTVFDILFGSFSSSQDSDVIPRQVGLADSKVPKSYLGQLMHPFKK